MESFHFKTSLLSYVSLEIHLYDPSYSLPSICLYTYAYIPVGSFEFGAGGVKGLSHL